MVAAGPWRAWRLRKLAYELTFASAVGLELFAYGGGDGFGVCHIHDDESLARARRLCEVICGTSGAPKSDDRGSSCDVTLHLSEGLLAAAGDERDDMSSPV